MSWYSKARDWLKWRGTFEADHFVGDASQMTGAPIAAENDPLFTATSNALAYVPDASWANIAIAEADAANLMAASAAVNTHVSGDGSDHADVATNTAITTSLQAASAAWNAEIGSSNALVSVSAIATSLQAASSAWNAEVGSSNALAASGATWTAGADNGTAASNAINASAANWATAYVQGVAASNAIIAHTADTSDAHGANTTQTGTASFASVAITADNDASGAAICRNILIGTEATPGPANLYPQGTIYFQYTA